MEFEENFGAKVNNCSLTGEHMNIFIALEAKVIL